MSNFKNVGVVKVCPKCREKRVIRMSESDLQNLKRHYSEEVLIQDVLPDISRPERELLRGGMCGECWIKTFRAPLQIIESE